MARVAFEAFRSGDPGELEPLVPERRTLEWIERVTGDEVGVEVEALRGELQRELATIRERSARAIDWGSAEFVGLDSTRVLDTPWEGLEMFDCCFLVRSGGAEHVLRVEGCTRTPDGCVARGLRYEGERHPLHGVRRILVRTRSREADLLVDVHEGMEQRLRRADVVEVLESDETEVPPEIEIELDRDRLAELGLDVDPESVHRRIDEHLREARESGRTPTPEDLGSLVVNPGSGSPVTLERVAKARHVVGPPPLPREEGVWRAEIRIRIDDSIPSWEIGELVDELLRAAPAPPAVSVEALDASAQGSAR